MVPTGHCARHFPSKTYFKTYFTPRLLPLENLLQNLLHTQSYLQNLFQKFLHAMFPLQSFLQNLLHAPFPLHVVMAMDNGEDDHGLTVVNPSSALTMLILWSEYVHPSTPS